LNLVGAASAATPDKSEQTSLIRLVPVLTVAGKLNFVGNRSAHSRDLRKGRYSEAGRIYFVTTSCIYRQRLFVHSRFAHIVTDEFEMRADEGDCDNLAYVVMPDHIHWLVQPGCDVSLHEIVRKMKGRSARRINLHRSLRGRVWQAGFHDHALRTEDDIESLATYLIQNPVRAGLVSDVTDYPHWKSVWHSGSGCRG